MFHLGHALKGCVNSRSSVQYRYEQREFKSRSEVNMARVLYDDLGHPYNLVLHAIQSQLEDFGMFLRIPYIVRIDLPTFCAGPIISQISEIYRARSYY